MNYFRNPRRNSDICGDGKEIGSHHGHEQSSDSSFCSAPLNATQRTYSQSVRDLQFLEANVDSTEPRFSAASQGVVFRDGKNRFVDDSVAVRSCSQTAQDGRLRLRGNLAVPPTSNRNSRSHTYSISSQESMEYSDAASRRPPEPLQGFVTKNRMRPMQGWHERFFSLTNGCLSFARNQRDLTRGKNATSIDLANTNVRYEVTKLRISIDTSAFVYHLKFKDPQVHRQWMTAIKEHRTYDQFQRALKSTSRPGTSQPISGTASNVSGDGIRSTSSCASLPATPEDPSATVQLVQSTPQLKTLKQTFQLPSEHIEALENQVRKLESAFSTLENAQSGLLESYIPECDTAEAENSSPSRSLFFSPLPFSSSEAGSTPYKHSRISSISSTTSMCTAVQATPTLIQDSQSNPEQGNGFRKPERFISAASNFGDKARRFIEEASAVLALIQQAHRRLSSAVSPNDEHPSILTAKPKTGNSLIDRTDTDSDFVNSEGSPSEDIPVLNESSINLPDMKGAELMTPEQVAGRRTALPAQQSIPTALSLLALVKNNIGREMHKLRLPAILNEPLSVLQNLCEGMEYSQLLDSAAEMEDKARRMLYVVTFIITGLTNRAYRKATKSFNPLLGETFECIRPEKHWRFLAEQVSLNPSVAAAHCESKLWIFDEEFCTKYKFLGKSLEINATGRCQLHFPKWRETYTWSTATTSLTNLSTPIVRLLDQNEDMSIRCSNGVTGSIRFAKINSKSPNANRSVLGTVTPPDSSEPSCSVYGQWDRILVSRDENNEDRCIWRAYPMPLNAQFFYGFTQFAIELNEPPAQDAISSGRLPVTDTRRRPDIRLLELGRVEDAEAENRRLEDDQRRRMKNYDSKDGDVSNTWKPLWFTRKLKPMDLLGNGSGYEFNPAYWRYRESGGFKDLNLPVLW